MWTIGAETDHGDPIISYYVEGETDYYPGQWTTLMTGKIALFLLSPTGVHSKGI